MKKTDQSDSLFPIWFRSIFDENSPRLLRPLESTVRLSFIHKLFDEFEDLMANYSVEAVARGLERFIDPGRSDDLFTLTDDRLPLENRIAAISGLNDVLRYFEIHCLPVVSHNSEMPRSPLNDICYRWWDIFPACPAPGDSRRKPIDDAFLQHLTDALNSKSPALQEYGLHGLGHWQYDYPEQVAVAVDNYLNRNQRIDEALKSYAMSAREGMIR